jgi:hypothetical protein
MRDLPALLCSRLNDMSPEQQAFGLDRAIEMFRYRTREFTAEESVAILTAAAPVFVAGRLELEPTKKLARLLTSVIIFKKEALTIPDGLRRQVMDALKVELATPRARDEAALRGILRDLQSALGGQPVVIKPILPAERSGDEWIRQVTLPVADRAVRPETPSTTVH